MKLMELFFFDESDGTDVGDEAQGVYLVVDKLVKLDVVGEVEAAGEAEAAADETGVVGGAADDSEAADSCRS